jgi:hypothetical protein
VKVGDLVKVKESHWNDAGLIGIIVHDIKNKGAAFKVLLSHGRIRPKMFKQLELLSESW